MRHLLWLIPFGTVVAVTSAVAAFALVSSSMLWVPAILLGSIVGTGCFEKAVGAGFFPWKWQFRGHQNGQTIENQVARQPARNVKGAKR